MEQKEVIVLNPTNMLVTKLRDYFSKEKKDFDTSIQKESLFEVGVIEQGGSEIPKEWIGKIIYYHKNIADVLNIKKIGTFDLVDLSHKLIVRLDQNKTNY